MKFILESDKNLPFYRILTEALEYKAIGMMREFVHAYESDNEQWQNSETTEFLSKLGEVLALRNSVLYGKAEWEE